MKIDKAFSLAGVLALAMLLTGCDLSLQPTEKASQKSGSAPKPKPQTQKTVQKPQQPKPSHTQAQPRPQQQAQQQPQRRSVADDVNSVVNYGIGATQLKAKQNMQNKIQQINQQKNKELERALK